ncbi:MAG: tripartite tricarboxylate transporter TctB family protein [Deltaproteobacteria bacterium]|nr:tripartite tricarboxylate transporter TctB family protein [Deltaproteobacteria bacterium]
MKKRDILSSLFWMAVSIGVCYGGYGLDLGTLHDPGSGFMFFWVGIIMIGLSIGLLIRAIKRPAVAGELKIFRTGIRWGKVVSTLVALMLYAYVFVPLGFILSTVLLLIFLFKAVEPQRWSWAILGAMISTLAAYGVFHLWLRSPLPKGFLGIG